MIRRRKPGCLWLVAMAALGGCATVEPRLDYERVARHVSDATGQERIYQPDDDGEVGEIVADLCRDGITAAEAAEVCLLNNPSLQAEFMDVGMARADVVQAGLFSNPFVGISARFPDGGGLAAIEASVAQNLAELWQIPARKRAAERTLDAAILDLARTAAGLAADTKIAYYAAVGADERLRIARENLEIATNLLDLALARQQAGAASELDVNLSRSVAVDGEIAVEEARLAAADARGELAALMGLVQDPDGLDLTDPLPSAFPDTADASLLVELAKLRRLDVQAAGEAVAVAEAELEQEYLGIFPTLELGLDVEREDRRREGGRDVLADTARASISNGGLAAPDIQPRSERRAGAGHDVSIGPGLGFEIPIFDQNQAQIAKAKFALQQARKTREALGRAVTREVRRTVDRAQTAWRLRRMYQERSIPLAQNNLDLSREAYRAGRASFLAVLEAQRLFLETRTGFVEAAQSAATTIPELERAIGLPFDRFMEQVQADTGTAPAVEEED